MLRPSLSRLLLVCLALFGLPAGVAGAADSTDSRAAELARLRREVETLSHELQLDKEELRARLKATEAQKLEIEVQLRREELRLAQIEGEAASRVTELSAHTGEASDLGPALQASIRLIWAEVEAGLPFRSAERLAELDRLDNDLKQGVVTPEAASARLWAFVEDELRLSRENALDRQIVALPEGEVLAEVARLGMVALYFRTDGGVVGAARRQAGQSGDGSGGAWTWVVFTDRDQQKAVEHLFEKLRHGVRSGAFTLPNPNGTSAP